MTEILSIKVVHMIGAALIFGTGLGTAFHMWAAHRRGGAAAIATVARNVVLADWLFTAPAVVAQLLTGLALAHLLGYTLDSGWLLLAMALYLLAGACWLPVVWLQIRIARIASVAAAEESSLPPEYHRYMRIWFWLGWPAFAAVLGIYHLMVFKPEL